jgi:hypothetical protein
MDTRHLSREEIEDLLHHAYYRPEELSTLLNMDVNLIRHAAFAGELKARVIDHHIVSIERSDVIDWLKNRI